MSLQDDIFDIKHALKENKAFSKREAKANLESFYNIIAWIDNLEAELEEFKEHKYCPCCGQKIEKETDESTTIL